MDDLISRQSAIDAIEKHIDTFDAIDTNYLDGLRTAMNLLHELPSAQPEPFGSIEHAGIEHPLSDREIIPRLRQIQEQVGGSYAIDRIIEIAMSKQPEPCEDTYGYIAIETLLAFCENSKDHAVTPNDFMRMKRVRKPEPCEDAVSRENARKILLVDLTHKEKQRKLTWTTAEVKQYIADAFEMLPSVTPKQRTGKWIKTARWRNVYKCDKCGNYLDFSGVNAGRGDANFCPNCGSRNEVTE